MKRLFTIFVFTLLVFLVAAIDVAFLPSLLGVSWQINLALILSLYIVIIINKEIGFSFFLITTLIEQLSSSQILITPLIIGAIVILLADILFESLFTNRSYYTLLALGTLSYILYYFLYFVFILIQSFFTEISFTYFGIKYIFGIIVSIIFSAIFLFILYAITGFMSKRFKSYFIISR